MKDELRVMLPQESGSIVNVSFNRDDIQAMMDYFDVDEGRKP
jgi:hypothetical protein